MTKHNRFRSPSKYISALTLGAKLNTQVRNIAFAFIYLVCLFTIAGCDGPNDAKTTKSASAAETANETAGTVAAKPLPLVGGKDDIFAQIWAMPESHVSVTTFDKNGKPVDPDAVVIVKEQGRAGSSLDQDNAPDPLIVVNDTSIFEEPTYKTFIALFDNYTAAEKKPEVEFSDKANPHWKEVDAFLDAVFASKPMQVAIEHIQTTLSPGISTEQILADVKTMWFEPYTNNYRNANPFCVGFEHVFVGEDESNESGAPRNQDRVGGYHSWVKFYLEQEAGKTDYLGYDYPDGNIADALANPKVTTIVMRWSPTKKEDGSYGNDQMK